MDKGQAVFDNDPHGIGRTILSNKVVKFPFESFSHLWLGINEVVALFGIPSEVIEFARNSGIDAGIEGGNELVLFIANAARGRPGALAEVDAVVRLGLASVQDRPQRMAIEGARQGQAKTLVNGGSQIDLLDQVAQHLSGGDASGPAHD